MNYYEKFKKDLKDGELGERVFAFYLKEKKGFEIVGFNNDYRYDIAAELMCKSITFEVKTDRYEITKKIKTNNIFIETSCGNKPSGISITEADVFVYFLPDFEEAYLIQVKKLKELLLTRPDLFRYITQNGDGGKVKGYLIDRVNNRELFKVYNVPKLKCWNKEISNSDI
jgi:hypothetical protein